MTRHALTCTARSTPEVASFNERVRRAAISRGLDALQTEELTCVVSRLGNNAVVRGGGGAVSVVLSDESWLVTTVDSAPGVARLEAAGLGEVARLSSLLSLRHRSTGAHVVAARCLRPRACR
ncbi:MAG: hypothetical protein ACO1OB_08265 [Archangium sp.]